MKSFFKLLFIILLLGSCVKKEHRSLIYKEENKDYTFHLYSIDNKIDDEEAVQCSKYLRVSRNDSAWNIYGANFKQLFSQVLHCNEKYIKLPLENNWKNKYFELKFFNTAHKQQVDSILIHHLQRAFNVEIQPYTEYVNAYQLSIIDSSLLLKFRTNDNLSSFSINGNVSVAKASNLKQITDYYDGLYSNFVFFNGTDSTRYSIEVPLKKDIAQANIIFRSFGLELKKKNKGLLFYKLVLK